MQHGYWKFVVQILNLNGISVGDSALRAHTAAGCSSGRVSVGILLVVRTVTGGSFLVGDSAPTGTGSRGGSDNVCVSAFKLRADAITAAWGALDGVTVSKHRQLN